MDATLSDIAEAFPGDAFAVAAVCPICSGSAKLLHSAFNIHPDKPHAFNFRICRRCSHGWIDPMPSQALLNYLYTRSSPSVVGEWGDKILSVPEQVCAQRELDRPPARYFELGVGQGALYQRFLERGWQCTGVDPGEWARGFPNVYPDLSEIPDGSTADLLVALDVLEHVSDPVAILRMLRKIAAPNARLYCAMPNRESIRARYHRERWRMLRPLGHVNYFSRRSIKLALESAGFALVFLRASDLWQVRAPKGLRDLMFNLIEVLGFGDQWIAMAEAR